MPAVIRNISSRCHCLGGLGKDPPLSNQDLLAGPAELHRARGATQQLDAELALWGPAIIRAGSNA
jgi:hypothetical protein